MKPQCNALNRIIELELPQDLDAERKKIIPTYNRAGALEKVDLLIPTSPTPTIDNYVENIVYNAKGQRLLIAFGNNRMTRYTYDPVTFRLLRQRTEGYTKTNVSNTVTYAYSAGTNKQDDGFNYDLVGNILNVFIRVTDCGIGGTPDELDRTFEYDSIYRLTYADGRESDTQSGNNYIYTDAPIPSTPLPSNVNYYERNFSYDKLGNVISVVQTGTNGFTRNYTYNAGNNTVNKIADSSAVTIEQYSYDACGNTADNTTTRYYIWNHADQLLCYKNGTSSPSVFTQYDYAGQQRVSKMVRNGNDYDRTIYIDGVFEYVKLEALSNTYEKNYIHIMDDKSRIAEVRINPGTVFPGDISDDITYILEDQIGSSVVRLNTSGTLIDEEEYYPFGDSSLRTFTYKRYRYVGKERDSESGLYYYGARYYVAWNCRFLSVDPLASKYVTQSSYVHADNNPINKVDHNGEGTDGGGEREGAERQQNSNTSEHNADAPAAQQGAKESNNIEAGKQVDNVQPQKSTPSNKTASTKREAVHKVKKEETLYGIAKNNNISVDELRKANNLDPKDDKNLQIGKDLNIPTPNKMVKPPTNNKPNADLKAAATYGTSIPQNKTPGPFDGINFYTFKSIKTAATLPPFGIFIGEGSIYWKMHEYGHYLQYKDLGPTGYYKDVAIPSAINEGTGYGGAHDDFYTEIEANRRAVIHFSKYFGKDTIKTFMKYYPINPVKTEPIHKLLLK